MKVQEKVRQQPYRPDSPTTQKEKGKMNGKKKIWRFIVATIVFVFLSSVVFSNAGPTVVQSQPVVSQLRRPFFNSTWSANVRVNDDEGMERQAWPDIAVDEAGRAYAVWWDDRDVPGYSHIYFAVRSTDGHWSSNVRVTEPEDSPRWGPAITVDGAGNAYILYTDSHAVPHHLRFVYRSAEGNWRTDVPVNDSSRFVDAPAIAVDGNGGAYALWMDERNDDGDIYFAYRPSNGDWGTNIRVNDDATEAEQICPSIAVDLFGNAYAVWADKRNGDWDAYFAYRPAGGNWGGNTRINDSLGTVQYCPTIAIDSSGNAYVVWGDDRHGGSSIYFAYRPKGEDWGPNVRVEYSSSWSWDPDIAVDPWGNAYAIWAASAVHSDIYFAYRPVGSDWGPSVRVDDDSRKVTQYAQAIAVDIYGNAYAVWADFRNETRSDDAHCPSICNFDIYFSYRPSGRDAKRPVVLLPGMTASKNWPCFLWEVDCDNPETWDWFPIRAQGLYQPLIDQFADAGYTEENHYLNIFFYDWRQPLADNATALKTRIAEVMSKAGATEVDLVGHSMGGLVARAYIQSSIYGNDVAHLITLGSPHQGAAKAYPYWEAAHFYRAGLLEKIFFSVLLKCYMVRQLNPIPVYTLREVVPSVLDTMPMTSYLYDEQRDDGVKAENGMIHRNTYLGGLNADLATLFARTEVSTFAGQDIETPVRFYVYDRPWGYPFPWNWDDGIPNWNREPEFMSTQGDGTVSTASASLTQTQKFLGVEHGALPGNSEVINAVFATLCIPIPTGYQMISRTDQAGQEMIVLVVNGPTEATITDPLGRSVGPAETSIPGAEYVSDLNDPFKLIIIPNPEEGSFEINLEGHGSDTYELSLLDTFGPPTTVITDVTTLWDMSQSQIEPATTVTFVLTYTLETSPTTSLIAVTPVIETPIWVGDTMVQGRALPGQNIEIRDVDTDTLLGNGTVDTYGRFAVSLLIPLSFGQRIYPWSNGVAGVPVTVRAYFIYFPLVLQNYH